MAVRGHSADSATIGTEHGICSTGPRTVDLFLRSKGFQEVAGEQAERKHPQGAENDQIGFNLHHTFNNTLSEANWDSDFCVVLRQAGRIVFLQNDRARSRSRASKRQT